jgi:hypothetical protein
MRFSKRQTAVMLALTTIAVGLLAAGWLGHQDLASRTTEHQASEVEQPLAIVDQVEALQLKLDEQEDELDLLVQSLEKIPRGEKLPNDIQAKSDALGKRSRDLATEFGSGAANIQSQIDLLPEGLAQKALVSRMYSITSSLGRIGSSVRRVQRELLMH